MRDNWLVRKLFGFYFNIKKRLQYIEANVYGDGRQSLGRTRIDCLEGKSSEFDRRIINVHEIINKKCENIEKKVEGMLNKISIDNLIENKIYVKSQLMNKNRGMLLNFSKKVNGLNTKIDGIIANHGAALNEHEKMICKNDKFLSKIEENIKDKIVEVLPKILDSKELNSIRKIISSAHDKFTIYDKKMMDASNKCISKMESEVIDFRDTHLGLKRIAAIEENLMHYSKKVFERIALIEAVIKNDSFVSNLDVVDQKFETLSKAILYLEDKIKKPKKKNDKKET